MSGDATIQRALNRLWPRMGYQRKSWGHKLYRRALKPHPTPDWLLNLRSRGWRPIGLRAKSEEIGALVTDALDALNERLNAMKLQEFR